MPGAPLLSIGLPFAATPRRYLEQAVRSVFAQSYGNWELILVADGPESDLVEWLRQIRDDRLRIVVGETNMGLAARLNQIARMARGDYLIRMDADDVMQPDRLLRCWEYLREHRDVDVLGARAYMIDDQNAILGAFREPGAIGAKEDYLRGSPFTHPSVIGRTEWFRRNRYEESLSRAEDKELWLRAAEGSRYAKLDDYVLYYRVANVDATKQRRDARFDRCVVSTYGPSLVGRLATWKLLGRSLVKQFAFHALTRFGGSRLILLRKREVLPPGELEYARSVLTSTLATPVPGWG